MSEWVKVAEAGDVAEGEINAYTVERTIAVANVDGDLQAFDERARTMGVRPYEGDLDGTMCRGTSPGHGAVRRDPGEVVGGSPPESATAACSTCSRRAGTPHRTRDDE